MEDRIIKWVNETGYPLELFANHTLRSMGFHTNKSEFYSDPQSGAAREIDLVASISREYLNGNSLHLQLIVECKKSKYPFVILASESEKNFHFMNILGNREMNDNFGEMILALLMLLKKRSIAADSNVKKLRLSEKSVNGYSLCQAFRSGDDMSNSALLGLAKADIFFYKKYSDFLDQLASETPSPLRPGLIQVPTLIIDAPLYTLSLDAQGELQSEEIEWGSITFYNPWDVEKEGMSNIQVIAKSAVEKYVIGVLEFLDAAELDQVNGVIYEINGS